MTIKSLIICGIVLLLVIFSCYMLCKSEISTYDQKSKALRELNRIVPEYNGHLDKTGRLVEGNTDKLEEYVNALERKARAEGFASLLVEEYKKAAEIEREIFLHREKMGKAQEKWFKDEYEKTVNGETFAAIELAKTEQDIIDGLNIKLAEQQKRIQGILGIAGQYVDVTSLVSRDNVNASPAKKETEKEDNQKEIDDAKKMFSELQKSAREYYESLEKLQDGALETMLRNENDRYMNELGVLTDAYNKAVDLSLKDADFLKKAGIDPDALQRYIKEISKAIYEALAFQKYGDVAKAQMVIEKLPEIAESVAKPISAIKDVRIYGGDGNGINQLSGNVPAVIKQTMDTVVDATGVDMQKIVAQSTLEGAVNHTSGK